MAYKIFQRQIPSDDGTEEELNRFLVTHRVVSVQTQWVMSEQVTWLVWVVHYVSGSAMSSGTAGASTGGIFGQGSKVDYKQVLSPEDFAVFDKLREVRRKLAESEKVKPFVVFTNAQLAAIVTGKVGTLAALGKVEGVGEARVKKYGAHVLAALKTEPEPSVETESKQEEVFA